MAYLIPVNGDSQPVFAIDVLNGPVSASASTAATPVNLAGPKLDFFRAVANTTVVSQQGVQEYVGNVIQAIQQTATVAMYQVDGTVLSFATYPTGAFANATTNTSAATFLAAANVTYTGYQLDSCTSVGFKLST
ncbi:MAG: hypothetical protein EBQ66_00620 [Flavobacteriia bacterium]|nr:hypothetical protein [Flavobacteriia bacterium]